METKVYDPADVETLLDPYATYRVLRDEHPVFRHPELGFYVLSRFADIWDAVRHPDVFSSASGLTIEPDEIGQLGLPPTIVMLDPPRHTELRRLISRGMTQRRVQDLEVTVRSFIGGLIDAMEATAAAGGEVDLHRDFSSPIPTFVLAHLLGVPPEDRGRFDPWVHALVALQNSGLDIGAMAAPEAMADMFGYFNDLVARRRLDPQDDLISALTQAEVDGDRLTDWDIVGFCFVMVAGGNDTTGNLISHGIALLDGDHAQRELLVAEPERIPNASIEFLRMESSVQALGRYTLAPYELHGTTIPAGVKVLMMYGAANRDEREFGPTADVLDVTRTIPRQLGFSSGPHFCVGSHLAQLQARVAFEELLRRHPTVGVDLDRAERLTSTYTRGWVHLPATGIA